MIINGVDTDVADLNLTDITVLPDVVPGRTVHIDADFLAYQVSSQEISLDEMKHNVVVAAERMQQLAGATKYLLHITPQHSNKGHRGEQALLKEYQANRAGKERPVYLHEIRDWMGDTLNGILWGTCEADDGMALSQYKAIAEGNGELSIIASMDKDLMMVPGYHLNWTTGEITGSITDTFGDIWIDSSKSAKKLVGYGTKFFWAQMLMGDAADNIAGLPLVVAQGMNTFKPTKATIEATMIVSEGKATIPAQQKARRVLLNRKAGKCGAMLTYDILKDRKSDYACLSIVKALYNACATQHQEVMVNYRDGSNITGLQALASNAKLLWMRRNDHDVNDAIKWIKEVSATGKEGATN